MIFCLSLLYFKLSCHLLMFHVFFGCSLSDSARCHLHFPPSGQSFSEAIVSSLLCFPLKVFLNSRWFPREASPLSASFSLPLEHLAVSLAVLLFGRKPISSLPSLCRFAGDDPLFFLARRAQLGVMFGSPPFHPGRSYTGTSASTFYFPDTLQGARLLFSFP